MYEELKARLLAWTKTSSSFGLDSIGKDIAAALEAIEQLEIQLADRDAEIAKYRDAPVVAYLYKYHNCFGDEVWATDPNWGNRIPLESKPLIVKPGK